MGLSNCGRSQVSTDHSFGECFPQIARLAKRCVGREDEISSIFDSVLDRCADVVTVAGPPGIGKTTIMCALAERLFETASTNHQVIPILCSENNKSEVSPARFVAYLCEQLVQLVGIEGDNEHDWQRVKPKKNKVVFQETLERLSSSTCVTIIVDGSEILNRANPELLPELIEFSRKKNVCWILSGRTEIDQIKDNAELRVVNPFGGVLPPLSFLDARAMILTQVGKARRRILNGEFKDNEQQENTCRRGLSPLAGLSLIHKFRYRRHPLGAIG